VTLRTDHVAGGAFVVLGLIVLAISGDLPVGTLSFPGAGMMPKLVTGLMIFFGLILMARAGESAPFATLTWDDLPHAGLVVVITAAAIACYQLLGFLITMALLLFGLLVGIERRHPAAAAVYSVATTALAYVVFGVVLKAQLEKGLIGYLLP